MNFFTGMCPLTTGHHFKILCNAFLHHEFSIILQLWNNFGTNSAAVCTRNFLDTVRTYVLTLHQHTVCVPCVCSFVCSCVPISSREKGRKQEIIPRSFMMTSSSHHHTVTIMHSYMLPTFTNHCVFSLGNA
jgi:hypothetical protein